MGYNTRNILCNLTEEIRKSGGGGSGSTVVANPSGPATADLSKLQVGDGIYGVSHVKANVAVSTLAAPLVSLKVDDDEYVIEGGGSTVVANPSGPATADLSKLQVGAFIYGIQGWKSLATLTLTKSTFDGTSHGVDYTFTSGVRSLINAAKMITVLAYQNSADNAVELFDFPLIPQDMIAKANLNIGGVVLNPTRVQSAAFIKSAGYPAENNPLLRIFLTETGYNYLDANTNIKIEIFYQ